MSELSNKSIVDHGCDTHAILCYGNAVVDGHTERNAKDFDNLGHGKRVEVGCQESEGKESSSASVVGCNANNDELGRTINANNAVANGNDNYARGGGLRPKCQGTPYIATIKVEEYRQPC